VLFVHGLWMTGAESFFMRRHLAALGWRLAVFPYSSVAESIEQVARRCAKHAAAQARRTEQPVHLLGHSLGGIVIYRALELGLLAPDRFSGDFCRVVLLGSPVRGSQSARVLASHASTRRLLGDLGGSQLPGGVPPTWPFAAQLGIIAGTLSRGLGSLLAKFDGPNDGTVGVSETHLEGATDICQMPVSHTGMVMSQPVAVQVAAFLERGKFNPT
jgi:pimeloyl-ACP methyl ester carboxylesterase